MTKFIVLICLLFGCNANVTSDSNDSGFGGTTEISSGGSGGSSTGNGETIISNPSTIICFQKQGDCKYIDSCEDGKITWKFEPSDLPTSNDPCIYFKCECSDMDCYPMQYSVLNGSSCGNNKYCLNGICK